MRATTSFCALAALAVTEAVRFTPRANTVSEPATRTTAAATYTQDPCVAVSSISSVSISAYPQATQIVVPPSMALECLSSIPVDVTRDVELLDYIVPFIESQSTLAFLRNPTNEYLLPGVDVLEGIADMRAMLTNGTYTDQYDFITDLFGVFLRANDGHFLYIPALVNSVFRFHVPLEVVSLSSDGQSLPELYSQADIEKMAAGEDFTPSSIVSVDGISGVEFVESLGYYALTQDPDTIYNSLTNTPLGTYDGNSYTSFFDTHYIALPDTLEVVFSNGSSITIYNEAVLVIDFTNIDSGADIHRVVEIPSGSAAKRSTTAPLSDRATAPSGPIHPNFPWPVVADTNGIISGYFLNDTDYQDTAVLAVYAFITDESTTDTTQTDLEFRSVLTEFMAASTAANKTRLIIDLQLNGGGSVVNGLELFKQLFPTIDLFTPTTLRATPFLSWVLAAGEGSEAVGSPLDADGETFKDWTAVFGPEKVNGDDFTEIFQYNFSAMGDNYDYIPSGYGPGGDSDIAPTPFTPENIVIVTDGQCGSTCTIFTGMATRLAGVRTIAYGGRPLNQPMQAMGGVKGSQVETWRAIQSMAAGVRNANGGSVPSDFPGGTDAFPSLTSPPLLPDIGSSTVNWKNAHRDFNDTTPLQFVYEAANCKQFYTVDTWLSITRLWESAADIAWEGAKCVPGSTVNSDNTISSGTLPFTTAVRASANFFFPGPGAIPYNPDAVLSS
ncbi:hypothetical protein BX600DRAFT_499850 [Xylariales sp. PMI_506]|nr:hypothetical protein BX600DRAFT_499850 [Xylariales sp. PMI_506]